MNLIKTCLLAIILMSSINIYAQQQSVGVFLEEESALDGYTFFSPWQYQTSYLIDNCGFVINSWDRNINPGLSGYLLPNGNVLRTGKMPATLSQTSGGGLVELVDWDNNLIWSYVFNSNQLIQHHDVKYMPNGNILILGWEAITTAEQIDLGRKNEFLVSPVLYGEFIYEVKPVGSNDIEIVWEWHLKDHLIQDHDQSKDNYGIVADNLGKVDLNYKGEAGFSLRDWWHCNAIDYNPRLDQVLINSRNNHELWIIDHSTTTQEAAGESGGNSGKGGEIIFRWGNPEAYDRGDRSDLGMFGSHGVHWIEEGLPNEGAIMFFNNGTARPEGEYSTIDYIKPAIENDYNYSLSNDSTFALMEYQLVYQAPNPRDFHSPYLSNAQQLENGNILINKGGSGHIFEVDPNGKIVWDYINPISQFGPIPQGSNPSGNGIFRAYKFSENASVFSDKDLVAGALLEINSDYLNCIVSSNHNIELDDIQINFDLQNSYLSFSLNQAKDLDIMLFNLNGKKCFQKRFVSMIEEGISLNHLSSGLYYLVIANEKGSTINRKLFIP